MSCRHGAYSDVCALRDNASTDSHKESRVAKLIANFGVVAGWGWARHGPAFYELKKFSLAQSLCS